MKTYLLPFLLLGALLTGCGKKTDDPQAATSASTPLILPVEDVPGAPAYAGGSQMQVRVTGTDLGTLQSNINIDVFASTQPYPHTPHYFTKSFASGSYVATFNVGTMGPYAPSSIQYICKAEARILGATSYGALPNSADMWIDVLKDGQVVATSHIASTDRKVIAYEWRSASGYIYSGTTYTNH